MAPKRQRGASSSGSFDSNRFVSKDAQDRYNASLKRALIKERGILVNQPIVSVIIEHRMWEVFCQQPDSAVVPVVREFYANAREHVDHSVMVRGKQVAFDRTAINRYYHVADIEDDEYQALLLNENKWTLVIEDLATPDTQWKMSGSNVRSFSVRALTRESKAWHYFVGAKLLPVKHFSDIYRDRAALVYAIQQDFTIDIGKIIHREILRCAESTTTGLAFPSMITGLCKLAGVPWEATEEWLPPLPLIDQRTFFQIKDRPYQGGSSSQAPPAATIPSAATSPPPSAPPPDAPIDDRLTHAIALCTSTLREVQRCHRDTRILRHRQERWEQHQIAYSQALAENITRLATRVGLDASLTVPFPTWDPNAEEEEATGSSAGGDEEEATTEILSSDEES